MITYFLLCGASSIPHCAASGVFDDVTQDIRRSIAIIRSRRFKLSVPPISPSNPPNTGSTSLLPVRRHSSTVLTIGEANGCSPTARDFISRCLTISTASRITAHEALSHPFLLSALAPSTQPSTLDLLPGIKAGFDAKKTFRRAIFTVRAANALKGGGRKLATREGTLMEERVLVERVQQGIIDAEMESVSPSSHPTSSSLSSPRRVWD